MQYQKKEKHTANGMVLHVVMTKTRMNGVIIVAMSEKIVKNKSRIKLFCENNPNPRLLFSKSFLIGLHTTFLITALFVVKWFKKLLYQLYYQHV
jgi:hypothetical protein